MKLSTVSILMTTFILASCVQDTATRNAQDTEILTGPRILAMGDSMMAAHRLSGRAISNNLSEQLNEPVKDFSVVGARLAYALPISGALGMNIGQQYRNGAWDWVVLNGGGNDLWFGCGCNVCDKKMNSLISADGTSGKIPSLISQLRGSGAQVLWLGYLRSPGMDSPIESCATVGNELEARITKLAKTTNGLHYLSNASLVPHGDRSFHGLDMIHPSLKGSREIASRAASYIRKVDRTR